MTNFLACLNGRMLRYCMIGISTSHWVVANADTHSSIEEPALISAPVEHYIDIDALPDPSSLYQVELLIFKNNQLDSFDPNGILTEQWPDELTLEYPDSLDFVHPPLQSTIQSTEKIIETVNTTLIPDEASASSQEPLINSNVSANDLMVTTASDADDHQQITGAYTKQEIALSTLALLTELPKQALILSEAQEKISRNTVHRVLYHQAWIQSLDSSVAAKAIPIFGGEKYNDHYQLEGHVTISKDRFLHIKTDLWLMEFTAIELSNKDIQQQSLAHQNVFNLSEEGFPGTLPDLPIDNERIALIEDQVLSRSLNAEIDQVINEFFYFDTVEVSPEENDRIDDDLFNLAEVINEQASKDKDEAIAVKENQVLQYQLNQVYAVRQNKKISSRQINYLDHPKIGVIVSVKKHILPEPD
ncbi:MAG: hypothetical protein CL691_07500 [Cellvibrionales bacterium]|nr:hypothetical protein [Cellvibrionales bacterium]|tara:strand:- start:5239 stop:6486 length:1248 start_codon:yes stop_codon:yes gene_type:complete